MKPLFISIVPGDTNTVLIVATLLALFGMIALFRNSGRMAPKQKLVHAFDFPFPTGAVSQIKQANSSPIFSKLFKNEDAPTVQPTGSIMAIGNHLPPAYAGPVVMQGSKYLWESRWSHLPSFEQGREGEERVVNTLMNALPNGWYIFRNFVLPTENEDIDVVLVGPAGIVAMEVKNYTGEVKFERGRCYVRTAHGNFYRQRRGASGQVRNSAVKLNSFLKEKGIASSNYVKPMVVMSGESAVEVAATRTDVCTVTGLRTRLNDMTAQEKLSAKEVRRIAGVLQSATREQMRANLSRVH